VITHPVTGLKALNVNEGFVTGFAELKKYEAGNLSPVHSFTECSRLELIRILADKLLEFFNFHIHSADDHYVRWKWAKGSVAMWDNVSSVYL
jgi:sulfonate dioxygenase